MNEYRKQCKASNDAPCDVLVIQPGGNLEDHAACLLEVHTSLNSLSLWSLSNIEIDHSDSEHAVLSCRLYCTFSVICCPITLLADSRRRDEPGALHHRIPSTLATHQDRKMAKKTKSKLAPLPKEHADELKVSHLRTLNVTRHGGAENSTFTSFANCNDPPDQLDAVQ